MVETWKGSDEFTKAFFKGLAVEARQEYERRLTSYNNEKYLSLLGIENPEVVQQRLIGFGQGGGFSPHTSFTAHYARSNSTHSGNSPYVSLRLENHVLLNGASGSRNDFAPSGVGYQDQGPVPSPHGVVTPPSNMESLVPGIEVSPTTSGLGSPSPWDFPPIDTWEHGHATLNGSAVQPSLPPAVQNFYQPASQVSEPTQVQRTQELALCSPCSPASIAPKMSGVLPSHSYPLLFQSIMPLPFEGDAENGADAGTNNESTTCGSYSFRRRILYTHVDNPSVAVVNYFDTVEENLPTPLPVGAQDSFDWETCDDSSLENKLSANKDDVSVEDFLELFATLESL